MDYLDKVIPLAVLAIAAAFLVMLIRRVGRENDASPRVEAVPKPIEAIAVAVAPVVAVVPKVDADGPPPIAVRPRRKKDVPTPTVVKALAAPTPTSIQTVLGLLREKDSLAVAFVLHEILGPPVSKRFIPGAR
jgi:hypothetical protein